MNWQQWSQTVESMFSALCGICYLHHVRDSPCKWESAKSVVESTTSQPFDSVTLEAISKVFPLFSISNEAENPGAVVYDFEHNALAPATKKRKAKPSDNTPVRQKKNTGFSAKRKNYRDVNEVLSAERELFRTHLQKYVASQSTVNPPPLHTSQLPAAPAPSQQAPAVQSCAIPGSPIVIDDSEPSAPLWTPGTPVTTTNFLDFLESQPTYQKQIVSRKHLSPSPATVVALEAGCITCEHCRAALSLSGITQIYSHQADALQAVKRGSHVIITTPTSSGKSLVYTLPALHSAICVNNDPEQGKSLLIFPTKALAQDQLASIQRLISKYNPDITKEVKVATLDGDTDFKLRSTIRDQASIILTNPDMLHITVLPQHNKWAQMLATLKLIVVDEAHHYRGVFGSHVALILRRLLRVCANYGASPVVVCCSATLANPLEHITCLVGANQSDNAQSIVVVSKDGSAHGSRTVALWNPPLLPIQATESDPPTQARDGKSRRSAITETVELAVACVTNNLQTLVFVKSRSLAELVLEKLQSSLPPGLAPRVASYRAGYTAESRRTIERDLASRRLLCVVATNALEMGINLGGLDVTLHVGFPSSVNALWQQVGRCGRNDRTGVSVLVAMDSPLDQMFAANPDTLWDRPPDHVLCEPENPHILATHVTAACWELPLPLSSGNGLASLQALKSLLDDPIYSMAKFVEVHADVIYSRANKAPAYDSNIRSIDPISYKIIDDTTNETLETLDQCSTYLRLYDGAVFLHQGKTYVVDSLDLEGRTVRAVQRHTEYFTETRDHTQILIRSRELYVPAPLPSLMAVSAGRVHISFSVYGYKKRAKSNQRLLEVNDLFLPPIEFETGAVWMDVPDTMPEHNTTITTSSTSAPTPLHEQFNCSREDFEQQILHTVEHLMVSVAPSILGCEASDLGCQCTRRKTDPCRDRLMLYERTRGGSGLAQALATQFVNVLQLARACVESCPCANGCMSCVYLPSCRAYNDRVNKQGAVRLLQKLLGDLPVPSN